MACTNLKPCVLVVEDDEAIVTLLTFTLNKEGYEVRSTSDGEEALVMVKERKPDLILLDWMLPGLSGIEVCNQLRNHPETAKIPVIMLSARGEEGDRIEGLDRGADDYLTKPFSPKELISRINAVFRRIRPAFTAKTLSYGEVTMDLSARKVSYGDKTIHLGPIEYKLLQSLLEYPKRVLSREQLIRRVWGDELHVEPRTVDVHINRLRKAIQCDDVQRTMIKTIRSAGYCIRNSDDDSEFPMATSIIDDEDDN
jgi:two-component system phosphate regulon response regulator PhoB